LGFPEFSRLDLASITSFDSHSQPFFSDAKWKSLKS
jgi:hypothetical protein